MANGNQTFQTQQTEEHTFLDELQEFFTPSTAISLALLIAIVIVAYGFSSRFINNPPLPDEQRAEIYKKGQNAGIAIIAASGIVGLALLLASVYFPPVAPILTAKAAKYLFFGTLATGVGVFGISTVAAEETGGVSEINTPEDVPLAPTTVRLDKYKHYAGEIVSQPDYGAAVNIYNQHRDIIEAIEWNETTENLAPILKEVFGVKATSMMDAITLKFSYGGGK